jgi:hypothetical protein
MIEMVVILEKIELLILKMGCVAVTAIFVYRLIRHQLGK